ncbi:MAG: peptide chain release factor 2 [Bacillota bacterium]
MDYDAKIEQLENKFDNLGVYFDQSVLTNKKNELEERMSSPGFWDDNDKAKKIAKKLDKIKNRLNLIQDIEAEFEDAKVYHEFIQEGEDSLKSEIVDLLNQIEGQLDKLELRLQFTEEYDQNNAIFSIHPGAGGTESQDWAQMLLRMYERWFEKKGFSTETLDFLSGDEAGIKRVTILVKGDYAYGYLKGEAGVHRLVRISPFDSSGRRHTSFASVDVLPEIDEELMVDIDESDLRIETYRASGAGGQHVNKTDSAVRITHKPTGIVVQCQNERSQHKNKSMAMKILNSKLIDLKKEEKAEEIEELRGDYKEIAWGSQIRSYTFHPYNLIKDHRTGVEEGNIDKVMDGNLDEFIEAYLYDRKADQ